MKNKITEDRVEEILLEHFIFGLFDISVEPKYIVGIYKYGSRLYGTDTESSDLDYCIIIDNDAPIWPKEPKEDFKEYSQLETSYMDLHIISKRYYEYLLEKHDIMALECYYQEEPIKKCEVDFELNLQTLRKSISSIVSNSWVKAFKKIQIAEESTDIGLKSLFHSLRIIEEGTSIAKNNTINFDKHLVNLEDIIKNYNDNDIDYLKNKYKPIHNKLMTEFRKLAPKDLKVT